MLDALISKIASSFDKLTDMRRGQNKQYSMREIGMAAFSVFFLQSPSFLSHQQRLEKAKGKHNGHSLFGFKKIPTDNHIRNNLDGVHSSELKCLHDELIQEALSKEGKEFQAEGGLVVALDGTEFFSSEKISCECCLSREKNGKIRKFHSMLCPVIVHPEKKCVLPMPPEFIKNQDGNDKQDCEINAAKRWCTANKQWLIDNNATIIADDLYSRTPFCEQIISYEKVRFILVCKPESHKYLNDWVAAYDVEDTCTYRTTIKQGNKKRIFEYKFYNNIPLTGEEKSLKVNYFVMQVTDSNGKVVYRNSFITNHTLTTATIHNVALIGRARWKIENEAFNVMKNSGYNLEHNFGHGKKNLANTLAALNILAFLSHWLCKISDILYQKVAASFSAQKHFFSTLNGALTLIIFDSWQQLFSTMIDSYEL